MHEVTTHIARKCNGEHSFSLFYFKLQKFLSHFASTTVWGLRSFVNTEGHNITTDFDWTQKKIIEAEQATTRDHTDDSNYTYDKADSYEKRPPFPKNPFLDTLDNNTISPFQVKFIILIAVYFYRFLNKSS